MAADTPGDRKRHFVRRIVDAERADEPAVFETDGVTVVYDDRTVELELTPDQRARLESLLSEYRVFKLQQPETRKAADGVVYVSAVTDAKHAADFLEAVFREVYGRPRGYEIGR